MVKRQQHVTFITTQANLKVTYDLVIWFDIGQEKIAQLY
jgi:hypothetical protein